MGLAIRSGSAPHILIGPSGTDPKFDDLVEGLEGYGCVVKVFDDLPIQPPFPKRAHALVVVTKRDTIDTPDGQRVQGLIREAGFIEGSLGRKQVVLLVDESAPRLSDTGLDQIRYPAGNLRHVLPDIVARFGLDGTPLTEDLEAVPPGRTERDLHRQVPIVEQLRADDLKVPWVLVSLVVLVAALAGLLLFRRLVSGESQEAAAAADATGETVTMQTLGSALAPSIDDPLSPTTSADRSSGQLRGATATVDGGDDDLLAGRQADSSRTGTTYVTIPSPPSIDDVTGGSASITQQATTQAPVTEPVSSTTTPTSAQQSSTTATPATTVTQKPATTQAPPPTGVGGEGLPATCYFDLRANEIVAEEVYCDGSGRVVVRGWAGPWHNEIFALAIGEGVTGTITHEVRPDGTTDGPTERELTPGVIYLNERDAAYGVHMIKVQFGRDEQHFHLYQSADAGGEQALMTFVVD